MRYEVQFLYSMCLTLSIEIPIVLLIVSSYFDYVKRAAASVIRTAALASLITLPYFWFVLPFFIRDRILYLLVGEFLVVVLEAVIYYRLLKLKLFDAFVASFAANIISALVGIFFFGDI